ncbi:UDP-N-acetylmuramoyl-L-alanine--D-glutamate ligase [Psychromonas sp. PT13]|uniref:UDP-N-acetylmuramoyl-L-alanine--D-glutamate ligase n=1 Tax=Psychromonas sp. PT13 TaxID=3439547 RepID=UPI003EBEDBAA
MLNEQVAVLGLGLTGLSCVNYLLKEGHQVTVFDTRDNPPGCEQLPKHVALVKGTLSAEVLATFPLIISSPGIALSTPALQFAAEQGCEIIGDIELFARQLKTPAYRHAKLVAITGSNGKTTVTSLLGEMAKEASIKVGVGGNIGVPALDLLSPDLDLYILELSSFQLETTHSLNATVATILNVSEDHMNRYRSFQHYAQSKQRVYQQCELALVNRDDPLTYPELSAPACFSFGFDQLQYGLIEDPQLGNCLAKEGEVLLPVEQLKLSGKHNWMNALAALALGDAVNIEQQAMLRTLQQYGGLAHRCEFIDEVNGVRWINDSKATNVGATLAALTGLQETISGNVHVILGGEGKGADFTELSDVLNHITGLIVCFGKDGKQIAAVDPRSKQVENLDQAVELIASQAVSGDLAILTPACASLDMYPNFMARGDHLRQLVSLLKSASSAGDVSE